MSRAWNSYCSCSEISGLSLALSSTWNSPRGGEHPLVIGVRVSVSRSPIIFLPLCLASALFSSACGLTSKPLVLETVPQREAVEAESTEAPEHQLRSDHFLRAENVLPKPNGIYHKLRPGQTLSSLSRFYQVSLNSLKQANRIGEPTKLRAGTLIFIPRSSGREPLPETALGALSWPLRGRITGRFGPRGERSSHRGIDIDGQGGDEIRAAAAGTVIRTGTRGKYGRMVLLEHGDSLVTLYAHVGNIKVEIGDRVERGDPIAEVGRSGNATGTHLHFEVQRHGQPVDPTRYLQPDGLLTANRR
jgi:murein DD-endopeptidase MepM/ murein hydrolase activator NlpD